MVCTDLAARGLDLDVDHVIMFDFPLNSVSIRADLCQVNFVFLFAILFGILHYFFLIRLITFIEQEELLEWVQKVCKKFYVSLFFSSHWKCFGVYLKF